MMEQSSSFIPRKKAINKYKTAAVLAVCKDCKLIWWSVSKRRFVNCLKCKNLVLLERRLKHEPKIMRHM